MDVNQDAEPVKAYPHLRVRWLAIPTLIAAWLGLVGVGFSWMWEYEVTPSEVVAAPPQWPEDARIERSPDRPTLVVFAHSRCPCTRATIGELSSIVAHCHNRVDVHVLFFRPSKSATDWETTDIWYSAEKIPGVEVATDEGGSEATRFRVTTSGQTLLYDSRGKLLFSGGITGARGHSGDNAGRLAIESLVLNGRSELKQSFVFGCPLLGRDDACETDCQP